MNDFPEEISILRQRLSEAEKYLKIDERKDQKLSLEEESSDPNLRNDQDKGRQVQTDLARVVADYISGMTDRYALTQHSKVFDKEYS